MHVAKMQGTLSCSRFLLAWLETQAPHSGITVARSCHRKARMGATLPVTEALQGLANSKPSARLHALAVVQQWQDAVSRAAASGDVSTGLVFAQERLRGEALVVHLDRFLQWLKSADPWMRSSTRDLFEQKISPQVLAETFHKIVPPLLADVELRPWSFGFLAARMSPSCLTELIDLIARQGSSWCKEPETLEFMKDQLPQELDAEHVDRLLGLLASNDCKIRCWTLNLLNHRVPKKLLSEEVLRLLVQFCFSFFLVFGAKVFRCSI